MCAFFVYLCVQKSHLRQPPRQYMKPEPESPKASAKVAEPTSEPPSSTDAEHESPMETAWVRCHEDMECVCMRCCENMKNAWMKCHENMETARMWCLEETTDCRVGGVCEAEVEQRQAGKKRRNFCGRGLSSKWESLPKVRQSWVTGEELERVTGSWKKSGVEQELQSQSHGRRVQKSGVELEVKGKECESGTIHRGRVRKWNRRYGRGMWKWNRRYGRGMWKWNRRCGRGMWK